MVIAERVPPAKRVEDTIVLRMTEYEAKGLKDQIGPIPFPTDGVLGTYKALDALGV